MQASACYRKQKLLLWFIIGLCEVRIYSSSPAVASITSKLNSLNGTNSRGISLRKMSQPSIQDCPLRCNKPCRTCFLLFPSMDVKVQREGASSLLSTLHAMLLSD